MKFFTPQPWLAINKKSRSPKSDRQWAKNSIAYYSQLAKLLPRLTKSASHFFSFVAFMMGHSYDSHPEITSLKIDDLSKTEMSVWRRQTNRCLCQTGKDAVTPATAMPCATGRHSVSGIPWITSLRTARVSRATMMDDRARASKAVRNAVTQKPTSARTNPIRCSGGKMVSAWVRHSRAPFAVPA